MKPFILFVIATLLFACSNQSTHLANEKQKQTVSNSCFIYALNKDSIILKLQDSSSILKGELHYLPYEKDGTIGNLYNLKWQGDTLFGMYKSEQEGIESIGEIALFKKANSFVLTNDIWATSNYVYDSNYTNGKFINKTKIVFDGEELKEVDCKK